MLEPPPERMPPKVVEPVPPLATVSAEARVSAPAESKEDVAVCPNAAVFAVRRPEKRLVEVAAVEDNNGNVFTAVVEVAVKYWPATWPATESSAYGELVPIPTLPPRNWAA